MNNNRLYSTLVLGGVLVGLWYLYYINRPYRSQPKEFFTPSKNNLQAKLPRKTLIFLDIDGTVTRLPGEHPQGLFNQYFYYGSKCFDNAQVISRLFDNSEEKLELMQNFLQGLCALPKDQVEIIIVTNNFKEAVQNLWTNVLKCPWERVHPNSGFRGSTLNKTPLINWFLNEAEFPDIKAAKEANDLKVLYFDDDQGNFQGKTVPEEVKVIDCSKGNWLGSKLTTYLEGPSCSSSILECLFSFMC